LGIVIPTRRSSLPAYTVNGQCVSCGYRFTWIVFVSERPARLRPRRLFSPSLDP